MWCEIGIQHNLFACGYSVVLTFVEKIFLFPLNCLGTLAKKFSAIISLHYFPFSFISLSCNPNLYILVCLMVSHISLRFCSFTSLLFLSVLWIMYFLSTYLQIYGFFLLSVQIYCWIPLVNFFISAVTLFNFRFSIWFF